MKTYLKIIHKFFQSHLATIISFTLNFKPVPQSPHCLVILEGKRVFIYSSIQLGICPSVTLFLGAGIGSENPKNGSARLTNPFLYVSIFLLLLANYTIHTSVCHMTFT